MKNNLPLKMQLQLFAEQGESGLGQSGESTNQEGSQSTDPKPGGEDGKGADQKTFTRDDVAKMIAAETSKAVSKVQKEYEDKQAEADKLAKMNADEKAAHERKKLEEKIAEYEHKESIHAMSKEASKMLSDASIVADDEILSFVVKDTAEATQKAVTSFVALIDKKAEEKTKAALSGKPPKVNLTPGKQMTKSDIMKIADPVKRQQAIKDNIHLFKK